MVATQSLLRNAEAAQTIGDKLRIMRNQIDEAMRPAAIPLFDQLGHGVEAMSSWVSGHGPQIIGFFTKMTVGAIKTRRGASSRSWVGHPLQFAPCSRMSARLANSRWAGSPIQRGPGPRHHQIFRSCTAWAAA